MGLQEIKKVFDYWKGNYVLASTRAINRGEALEEPPWDGNSGEVLGMGENSNFDFLRLACKISRTLIGDSRNRMNRHLGFISFKVGISAAEDVYYFESRRRTFRLWSDTEKDDNAYFIQENLSYFKIKGS